MAEGNGAAVLAPPQDDAAEFNTGELVVDAGGQLTLNVGGGKQPTTSTLRIVGGKIEVDGEYKKGQTVALRLEVVVNEVSFKDQHDPKTSQVVGCARNHRGRVVGVHVID
jgi:hypothetical protein